MEFTNQIICQVKEAYEDQEFYSDGDETQKWLTVKHPFNSMQENQRFIFEWITMEKLQKVNF